MKLASIAEVQPILFKDTEYGLDNPTDNHECELYDTYQYVATKHNNQDSAYKEKHVSRLLKSFAYSLCSVSTFSVIISTTASS